MAGPRRAAIASLAICLAVVAWAGLGDAARITHGFVSYYGAARLWRTGGVSASVYDDATYGAYLRQVTGSDVRDIYAPNTPAAALWVLPLAGLSHATARTTWLVLSLLAVAGSIGWWAMARPTGSTWLWTALFMLGPPVLANLRTAQVYLVLFAIETVVIACLLRERDRTAGALLGVAFITKPVTGGVLLLLVTQRRWRAALAAVLSALAVVAASLPVVSVDAWRVWPGVALAFAQRPEVSVPAYQTTASLVRHLCVSDPQWNPQAPLDCEGVAAALPPLVALAVILVTVIAARGRDVRAWLPAAASLSLLALPIAEDHQFIALAIPVFLLSHTWSRDRGWWMAAGALMLVPGEWTWGRFTEGWWCLLAYPRLYATWIVWGLAIAALARGSNPDVRDAGPSPTPLAPLAHRG